MHVWQISLKKCTSLKLFYFSLNNEQVLTLALVIPIYNFHLFASLWMISKRICVILDSSLHLQIGNCSAHRSLTRTIYMHVWNFLPLSLKNFPLNCQPLLTQIHSYSVRFLLSCLYCKFPFYKELCNSESLLTLIFEEYFTLYTISMLCNRLWLCPSV